MSAGGKLFLHGARQPTITAHAKNCHEPRPHDIPPSKAKRSGRLATRSTCLRKTPIWGLLVGVLQRESLENPAKPVRSGQVPQLPANLGAGSAPWGGRVGRAEIGHAERTWPLRNDWRSSRNEKTSPKTRSFSDSFPFDSIAQQDANRRGSRLAPAVGRLPESPQPSLMRLSRSASISQRHDTRRPKKVEVISLRKCVQCCDGAIRRLSSRLTACLSLCHRLPRFHLPLARLPLHLTLSPQKSLDMFLDVPNT